MPWTLDYRSPEDRDLLDEFCLSVGRALCLASNFESKCRHIYWLMSLVDGVQAGNDFDGASALVETLKIDSKPLQRVIDVLGNRGTTLADDADTLMNAKNSRNFIAHKAAEIGPVSSASGRHLVKMASALYPHVVNVAAGDNLVSSWLYEISEREPAPRGIRETYRSKVVEWIYSGTTFSFLSLDDQSTS
jgi:hypothetical protein